jgi:hypothetical protein
MHRFRHVCALACLLMGLGMPALQAASVTENLVAGAVMVANAKLYASAEDQRGLDLLRFALALDPENRDALLIQAKIDRNQKLDDAQLADGGKQYVKYVLKIARHTNSRRRRLLLYKVVELVSPKNETAMLELTKAKNKGADVSFNALVQVILPEEKREKPDEGEKKEDVADDGNREAPAGKVDILAELEKRDCRRTSLYMSNPVFALNNLNRSLSALRVAVLYESEKHPIRRMSGYNPVYYDTTGATIPPQAFPNLSLYHGTTAVPAGYATQGDWLRLFCGMYGLGWLRRGADVVVVDPDHKGLEKGSGIPVKAQDLFDANRKGRLDFRAKYMGKRLFVSGYPSGVTKEYVHLANDRVRLIFDSSVKGSRIDQLGADYQKAVDEKRPMLLVATGVCETIRTGRIHLKDCKGFSWVSGYPQQGSATGVRIHTIRH